MEYYYGQPEGDHITLEETESRHLLRVRRARPGDIVFVTDGAGNLYEATVDEAGKSSCILRVKSTITTAPPAFSLHIAVAPTKNMDRIEWFLEKAVETGIGEVSFIECSRSERRDLKTDRLLRVMISSMKQSLGVFLPKINPMVKLDAFLGRNFDVVRIICTSEAEAMSTMKKNCMPGLSLIALIGPEGDFHPDELKLAISRGFTPTSLGNKRLRTETAALNVCTVFNFLQLQ